MESLGEDQTNVLDEEISKTSINGLKNFKRGVLGIKNLKGWEYVDLAFHMPHALYSIGADKKIITVWNKILEVLIALRKGEYTVFITT